MNSNHQLSGRSPEYNPGAYGRDGAPAQNFMSPLALAHRQPSPQRPNVAPSERSLPPMDRLSPTSHRAHRPPPTNASGNPFLSPLDPKLSPPKAAFLEPSSPTSHSFDSHSSEGLTHGELEKSTTGEDFYRPGARWKDLERAKQQESSTWLQKQSQAGSKFKIVTWIVVVIAVLLIGGLITKIVTKKSSSVTSPAPLKWANGADHVPTFGVNSTTTTAPTDTSRTSKADDSGVHSRAPSAKRHLTLLD